jgi:uncharacterized membrane protein
MSKYNKLFAALSTAIAGSVAFISDGEISQNDIIGIAALFIGALGVFLAPNKPTPGGN